MIALLLSCLVIVEAHAVNEGRQVLTNGATVEWHIDDEPTDPKLGLDTPAFVEWARNGLGKGVTVEMRSNALAAIDAWEFAFYRLGDPKFERPLRRFRGDARSLGRPLRWHGEIDSGPPLRPGETVVARLSVRDTAGTVHHATPQEMLIARYRMRAERRATAETDRMRARLMAEGENPVSGRILLRGKPLILKVENWPDSDGPRASGVRLRKRDDAWVMRQILPPGRHDVVIESTRKIIGGVRSVPVGIVSVEMPVALPFQVAVKGTARLVKAPFSSASPVTSPVGIVPEWTVSGGLAISRTLTNRTSSEDRLALALLSADRRVLMAKDNRMRRVFLSSYDDAISAWPAGYDRQASGHTLADQTGRRVNTTYTSPETPEIFLPHTDVLPDSITLTVEGDAGDLMPFRDYFPNAGEGRILLGNAVLSRFAGRPEAILRISYTVPVFAPESPASGPLDRGGSVYGDPWVIAEPIHPEPPPPKERGLLGKVLNWFHGEG